jgi:hypothetical protein
MTSALAKFISYNVTIETHIESDDVFGNEFDATIWHEKKGRIYFSSAFSINLPK